MSDSESEVEIFNTLLPVNTDTGVQVPINPFVRRVRRFVRDNKFFVYFVLLFSLFYFVLCKPLRKKTSWRVPTNRRTHMGASNINLV